MKKKIICTFLFLSHVLVSMQNHLVEKKHDKIFSPQEIVFNLVTLYYLDHRSICNFGATSKYNDRWMIEFAETRKKALGDIPEATQTNAWYYGAWHRYGSAYRSLYTRSYAEQKLHAKLYELLSSSQKKMSIYTYNIPTGDHIHPLSSKALPYYNAGACYFYGVRTTAIPYQYRIGESEVYHSISVCRFSFDGTARLECRLSVSNENSWGLRKFLDYPLLLEAILNSKIVSKKKRKYINVHGKCSKIMYWDYSLEGITIPDYYTEYIKKADSIRKTAAWNLLDQSLKKAIEARYQQQLIRRERKP